ncbi:MAG: hypothetical protein P4L69_14750 [Desulfosporosinus sp.]|nr:hypothetical protein [Desulfosporosinus sp.]
MVNTRRTHFSERVFPTDSYSSEEEEPKQPNKRKNPILPRQPKGPTLVKKCLTKKKKYVPDNPPESKYNPSSRSAEDFLLFCEALDQISPKVVRKEPTTSKSMPPIETGDDGVPIPYLRTFINYRINSHRKPADRTRYALICQGCTLKDENNCRGMFRLALPAFIREYMKAEKGLKWKITKEIPFIWLVLWMEDKKPDTEETDWKKYVITRTCGDTQCTNALHMEWALP